MQRLERHLVKRHALDRRQPRKRAQRRGDRPHRAHVLRPRALEREGQVPLHLGARQPGNPLEPRWPERERLGVEHKVDRRLEVGVLVVPRRVALPLRRHLRVQPRAAALLEAGALELLPDKVAYLLHHLVDERAPLGHDLLDGARVQVDAQPRLNDERRLLDPCALHLEPGERREEALGLVRVLRDVCAGAGERGCTR